MQKTRYDSDNDGIIAVANGGTGAATVDAALAALGLDQVDNTSDADKPVSTATAAALAIGVKRYSSIAAIEALSGSSGASIYLSQSGKTGIFVWDSSDLSALVTADTQQAIYIAPSSAPTGASGAWVRKYRFGLDAEWFGVVADDSTDNATALQAAITFAGRNSEALIMPVGTVRTSVGCTISSGIRIYGLSGALASIVKTTSATENIFTLSSVANAPGIEIDGLYFKSSATRSGGYYIQNLSSQGVTIRNCRFDDAYIAIGFNGTSATQSHVLKNILIYAASSVGIEWDEGTSGTPEVGDVISTFENITVLGESTSVTTDNGFLIKSVGDLRMDHCHTLFCKSGLNIYPGVNQRIQILKASHCYFDTGDPDTTPTGSGIILNASDASSLIDLVELDHCWSATSFVNPLLLTGSGDIRHLKATSCTFVGGTNNGVSIATTTALDTNFVNCIMAQNVGSGFYAAAGVSRFNLINCTFGETGQFTANAVGATIASGSSDDYKIIACTFNNNSGANLDDNGSGTNKQIHSNVVIAGSAVQEVFSLSGNLTADAFKSTVKDGWGFDSTAGGYSTITSGGTVTLSVGSGVVLVHDHNNGDLGVFIVYGGNVTKISGGASVVASSTPSSSEVGLYFSGSDYRVKNGYSSDRAVYISGIMTRPAV